MTSAEMVSPLVIWTVTFAGLYALSAIPGPAEYRAMIGGILVFAAILFTTVMSLNPQR